MYFIKKLLFYIEKQNVDKQHVKCNKFLNIFTYYILFGCKSQ